MMDLDDLVGEWHDSDDPRSLREYLGMTKYRYQMWIDSPTRFVTASTFDEMMAQLLGDARCVFATGELGDQLRARLNGGPDDRVWTCLEFDLARLERILGVDCMSSTGQFKDLAIALPYRSDNFAAVQAWVNGDPDWKAEAERIDREDWEARPKVTITLAEAFTAAADVGGRDLWQAIRDGIFQQRGAWIEATFVSPPAGMYDLWERAVDVMFPILGIDEAQFECACSEHLAESQREACRWCNRYGETMYLFADTAVWTSRSEEEVVSRLRAAAAQAACESGDSDA